MSPYYIWSNISYTASKIFISIHSSELKKRAPNPEIAKIFLSREEPPTSVDGTKDPCNCYK